jgi:hypothetical protein
MVIIYVYNKQNLNGYSFFFFFGQIIVLYNSKITDPGPGSLITMAYMFGGISSNQNLSMPWVAAPQTKPYAAELTSHLTYTIITERIKPSSRLILSTK